MSEDRHYDYDHSTFKTYLARLDPPMNTSEWASMEADSGGELPEVGTVEWCLIVLASVQYRALAGNVSINDIVSAYVALGSIHNAS